MPFTILYYAAAKKSRLIVLDQIAVCRVTKLISRYGLSQTGRNRRLTGAVGGCIPDVWMYVP